MKQVTARWDKSTGWSTRLPSWNGPGTLVVVFGSADLFDDDALLRAIAAAFGRSVLVGASTCGAILGRRLRERGADLGAVLVLSDGTCVNGSTTTASRRPLRRWSSRRRSLRQRSFWSRRA